MSYVMRNRTLTLNLWQMHMHMHAHKDLCIHTPMHAPTTPMNTQVNNYEWTKPLKCTGAGKSQWNRYSLFLMPNWLEKSTQTTFKIYARNVLSGLQKDGMNAARCSICLICTSAVGFFDGFYLVGIFSFLLFSFLSFSLFLFQGNRYSFNQADWQWCPASAKEKQSRRTFLTWPYGTGSFLSPIGDQLRMNSLILNPSGFCPVADMISNTKNTELRAWRWKWSWVPVWG